MPIAAALVIVLAATQPRPVGPVPPGTITSSDHCGSCHVDIYKTWKDSAHADALEGSPFLEAYRDAVRRQGPDVSEVCLRCHAPVVEVNRDYALDQRITWEGVSCDVCHSLEKVDLSHGTPRNVWAFGPVKRGPIRDAAPLAHEVEYSELHETSLGCAGCHEYRNGDGLLVLSTFSEWQASQAARDGVPCQACHMGRTRARVVDPRVHRETGAEINLHDVPGGHSLDQLHKALRVKLDPRREGDELFLRVSLENRGAGHAVPTGMPGRKVILQVTMRDTHGNSGEASRVYARLFRDASGDTIVRDGDCFARGVQLEEDSRIGADEERIEEFRFPVAVSATAFLTLKLIYEHSPMGDDENRIRLTFYSEDRTLTPEAQPAR